MPERRLFSAAPEASIVKESITGSCGRCCDCCVGSGARRGGVGQPDSRQRGRSGRLRPCQSLRHPENPKRYFLSRSRAPELVEPGDVLEYDLNSNPVKPTNHAALCRARDPRRDLQGAPRRHAVVHHHAPAIMPFCISGMRARSGVPSRRDHGQQGAVLGSARRVRRHQSAGGEAGGGRFARARARAELPGADESPWRDRGRRPTCRNSCSARSIPAATPSFSIRPRSLGHVIPLVEWRGRDGRQDQRAADCDKRGPGNTGRCGLQKSGNGLATRDAAGAPRSRASVRKAGSRQSKRETSDENDQGRWPFAIGGRHCARKPGGFGAGHAEDRDRPDQQLGEPGARRSARMPASSRSTI